MLATDTVLWGRRDERAAIDRLLEGVRAGHSGVLVLRGEPGVGKSALLDYARAAAAELRVVRAVGVDSEIELAFAGLQQLCSPVLDHLARLPEPQRDAIATAFGLTAGPAPDRFLVALAILSLLSDVAGVHPLVCVIDDAQWLDRNSLETLAFVARRLFAESLALIFATRESDDVLTGLPELRVSGLRTTDARALLRSVVSGPLDEGVRDRIVEETRGNPLALLELPRGLTVAELAGGFILPGAPLSGQIEASFQQRLEPLGADTRRLVLTAAADPVGDAALLWRACERLGIKPDAAAPAVEAGLLKAGWRVTFFHPLVRSAAYRGASDAERRIVHDALAQATDPELDPDRRAWHRAQAAAGPDDDVAAELERSADRAQTRGGLAAAAAFLERAATLTVDPVLRAERALAAAQAKHDAGAAEAALDLLALAETGPLDELQRARVERLRGRLAFAQRHGSDAPPLLLRAARRLEQLAPALARETYLEALGAALSTGQRDSLDQASQALRATPAPQPPRAFELLLTGQALVFTDGRAAGMPVLKQALNAFRSESSSGEDEMRGLLYACLVAIGLWDDESWHVLSARHVQLARAAGALTLLPLALEMHCASQVNAGEFTAAQALIDETDSITAAAGSVPLNDAAILLAGWRGVESTALERITSAIADATDRGEESTITLAEYASAVLYNGLGRHAAALAAAQRSCEHHPAKAYPRSLIELVEAATRCGKPELALDALEQLSEGTSLSGTDWALGLEARTRALLSTGAAAERCYREAIERLARTRVRVELARAQLLYGEWLRREGRRLDAREQLRAAHDLCLTAGMEGFATRAARELLAAGETARSELTAQEGQIARLARDGLSNAEIGARLFISPRSVQYHLQEILAKLDINSESLSDDPASFLSVEVRREITARTD